MNSTTLPIVCLTSVISLVIMQMDEILGESVHLSQSQSGRIGVHVHVKVLLHLKVPCRFLANRRLWNIHTDWTLHKQKIKLMNTNNIQHQCCPNQFPVTHCNLMWSIRNDRVNYECMHQTCSLSHCQQTSFAHLSVWGIHLHFWHNYYWHLQVNV